MQRTGDHFRKGRAWVSGWRKAAPKPTWVRLLLAFDLFLLGDAAAFLIVSSPPPAIQVGKLPAFVAGGTASSVQPPPVRLDIDSINVHSDLAELARRSDGTLETPTNFAQAGWFARGVAPGGNGNAVIVGHVDSTKGPAVFFRLRNLQPGAPIVVTRLDGSRVTFVLDGVQQFAKHDFPTKLVYGSSPTPQLRLITCGGRFNRRTRSYSDNIVAFAHATAPSEASI